MIKAGFTRSVEDDYEALVLLDEPSGDTLEFQRSLSRPDAQDAALGMDTYSIVRAGAAVHYGGLVRFTVEAGVFTLELTAEAAAVLELPQVIELVLDDDGARVVDQHLPRILAPWAEPEHA